MGAWNGRVLTIMGVLGLIAVPQRADAAVPDNESCASSDRFVSFEVPGWTADIPRQGILAFAVERGTAGALTDAEALQYVSMTVTGDTGLLSGSLQLAEGIVIWRPNGAFQDQSSILVEVDINNDAIDGVTQCNVAPPESPMEFYVDGSAPPLELPQYSFQYETELVPSNDLADFVCCGEAFPTRDPDGNVTWDFAAGGCAASTATREATVRVSIPEDTGASPWQRLRAVVKAEILVDGEPCLAGVGTQLDGSTDAQLGEFSVTVDRPFETTVRLTSLVDGDSVEGEPFVVPGQLGPRDLDPRPVVEPFCDDGAPLYSCAVVPGPNGTVWDPQACQPWPPPPSGSGDTDDNSRGSSGGMDGSETTESQTTGGPESTEPAEAEDSGADGCACRVDETAHPLRGLLLFILGMTLARKRRARGGML